MTTPAYEEWRVVPGFDGWYEVSSFGNVRSWRTNSEFRVRADEPRLRTGFDTAKGYRRIKLTHPVLGPVAVCVHHLVLATFRSPRPIGMVADHVNANRSDNRVENLRWVTQAENIQHAVALGRMGGRTGGRSSSALPISAVEEIRRRRGLGEPLSKLSRDFGVSKQSISRICRGESWPEVLA